MNLERRENRNVKGVNSSIIKDIKEPSDVDKAPPDPFIYSFYKSYISYISYISYHIYHIYQSHNVTYSWPDLNIS